jgi:DNA gyrase subunit A
MDETSERDDAPAPAPDASAELPPPPPAPPAGGEGGADDIRPISIVEEMKSSYLDYAMSVIVARALPDVRDGLKPVHRRILWTAHENGFTATKPYRKSARIVGDVMGKYHPHGDQAIYDALARMAQDWSMRVPLVDGQGNFGSMDPDPPASMRYTEARLARAADLLLSDIDEDTVDFVPNYDGSEDEPSILPARFPNLLVNGAGGIAVGMATNIPPHNPGEVIRATLALLDDPTLSIDQLMQHLPGPDFPTGALILGQAGIRAGYHSGRAPIALRSRHAIEEGRGERRSIVLTEIPFQVGKSALVEKIAEAVKDRRVEGISDVRDESNREGVRVVLDLKRDATPEVVLNQLWKHTPAQSSFGINMLALRGGRPELLDLKEMLEAFIRFREEVITRRSKFRLARARERAHILMGLAVAVDNLDEVVAIIRGSASPAEARERLTARVWPVATVRDYLELVESIVGDLDDETYRLSDAQARAILDLRLQKLTALGREEIGQELRELAAQIGELLAILADRARLRAVLRAELEEALAQLDRPRLTTIAPPEGDVEDEDLIERADMVVTVTLGGYIKRTPLSVYRTQGRGGKGRSAMATKAEDVVTNLFVASTHAPVLFFSSLGRVYRLKVWRLPEGGPNTRGRSMANLLPLAEGETIQTVLPLPEDEAGWAALHVLFATARGQVRRNAMDAFASVPTAGKIAMRFEDGSDDALVGVALCEEGDDALLATALGKAIRFPVSDVREFQSRASTGVRGMTLAEGDRVISLTILHPAGSDAAADELILTVASDGFGKRTPASAYRRTGRGGLGIRNIELRGGARVVASFPARDGDEIMLVTVQGKLIRTAAGSVRVIAGRDTRGVKLFSLMPGEAVVSAAHIEEPGGEEPDADSMNGT